MIFQAFLVGMLGSLAANLITRPVEQVVQNSEQVTDVSQSKLFGFTPQAVGFVSVLIIGSVIYIYSTREEK